MTLDEIYAKDKPLLKFYKHKLLIPGWAGELNEPEYQYIYGKLKNDNALRTKWGFPAGARRLSRNKIFEVAKEF